MFPLAFVAGWLQGHWWGFISRNYVVWPTFFLMTVFIALEGSHFWFYIWAASWQIQQNNCAPSEDSDQPGHPPSLFRVFAVRTKKAWVLSYSLSAQPRLWSDWRIPRLIWVFARRTVILLGMSWGGSIVRDPFQILFSRLFMLIDTCRFKKARHFCLRPLWPQMFYELNLCHLLTVLVCSV